MMTPAPALPYETELQRLIDRCEQAVYGLETRGVLPDLVGMDDEIAKICQAIEAAPPEHAKAAAPHLNRMIQTLDRLAHALQAYRNQLTPPP